jgi:hypothetical protein
VRCNQYLDETRQEGQQGGNDDFGVLLVIACHGGDPFVLDLSKSDGNDAPVDTAEHGMGVWEFTRDAGSFTQFLATLAR